VSDQILAHGLRLIAEELQLLVDEEAIPSNAVAATLERITCPSRKLCPRVAMMQS
jgi:hypothetical protein